MLRFIYFVTVVAAILSFADAIWNGETPEPLQYPYTVKLSMLTPVPGSVYSEVCGGALISNNLVITTATCLNFYLVHDGISKKKTIRGLLGGHRFFYQNMTSKYKFGANEKNVILHPKYNKTENMKFDIGLIRLRVPIKESDNVKIVSLPPENLDLPVGQDIIITGWRRSNNKPTSQVLKVLNTKVVPKEDCSKSDESVTEDNICVYTPQKSICKRDSGSPNYIPTKGKLILVGLSQRLLATDTDTKTRCERDLPHLSISIIPHLSWINSEINKNRIPE